VHLDTEMHDAPDWEHESPATTEAAASGDPPESAWMWDFPARASRKRFVSSVREVVDAEGSQVISNEVFQPGPDRRARASSPLRPATLAELIRFGYEPSRMSPVGTFA